ncbi:Brefeldin A-inhibited guanine nucleotide-exchange protein 2, partial [Blyttiomyces sp. JEL0837]
MADIIKSCLDRLLIETSKYPHKELKESITQAMEELAGEKDSVLNSGGNPQSISADKYWNPFKVALQPTQPSKMRETALDCLQKLIAHNILSGAIQLTNKTTPSPSPSTSTLPTTPSSSAKPSPTHPSPPSSEALSPSQSKTQPRFLIDEIITTVCTTFTGSSTDDSVQLQVIKVLLTAITSTSCEIHGLALLKTLHTCFDINIYSKSLTNQGTAKASLTQMVNLVFSRMERYAEVLKAGLGSDTPIGEGDGGEAGLEGTAANGNGCDVQEGGEREVNSERVVDGGVVEETRVVEDGGDKKDENSESHGGVSPEGVVEITEKVKVYETVKDGQGSLKKDTLDQGNEEDVVKASEEAQVASGSGETPAGPESESELVVENAPSLSVNLSPEQVPATSSTPTDQEPTPYDPTIAYYNELLRKDVFMVLGLLNFLSIQNDKTVFQSSSLTFNPASVATLPSDDVSQQAVKSRSLADDLYGDWVKNNLTASISRNAVTLNPTLFELSFSIFLMVIRFYRGRLKMEIEVILNMVYLHILEMGNSTYQQKALVLQGLHKISENPQCLADLYLNYDCDLATVSIFERIISSCAKVAQGKEANLPMPTMTLMGLAASAAGYDNRAEIVRSQEKKLRMRGLVCLVAIINSMVEWSAELGPALKKVGNGKEEVEEEKDSVGERVGAGFSGSSSPVGAMAPMPVERADSRLSDVASSTNPVRSLDLNRSENGFGESGSGSGSNIHRVRAVSAGAERVTGTGAGHHHTSSGPRNFLEALAPTTQVNPVIVNKHHLSSLTMSHQQMYNLPNASTGSLESTRTLGGGVGAAQGGMAGGGGAGESDSADAAQIEMIATRKALLKEAVTLFNHKPEKGLRLFRKHGFLTADDPESVARFLKSMSGLSKSALGDYLGEGDAFMIKVMHAFIDDLDFHGLDFVAALRSFLQTFRLPGEAQKISRFMEKFADRYCENNPDIFAKADTAYTLAYSVIMLNTDQHSPQIKDRMDKAAFIKNNRGINDNADLPDEFLGAIFDEINANEIIMEEERVGQLAELAKGWGAASVNDRQKIELYNKEMAQVQKKSQLHLSKSSGSISVFRTATQPDLARPMFATASWPMMATFSLLFEGSNDDDEEYDEPWPVDKIVDENSTSGGVVNGRRVSIVTLQGTEPRVHDLCLHGFANAIRVASICRMEIKRDVFVTSLCKLTGLAHLGSVRPKNVKAIKTLLSIAHTLGEYLESSWLQVLKVVSQMERLQLIGNNKALGEEIGNASPYRRSLEQFPMPRVSVSMDRPSTTISRSSIGDANSNATATAAKKANPSLDKLIAEFNSQSTVIAVDRIFSTTTTLSGTAILYYFKAVCHVSLEEVGIDPKVMSQFVASSSPTSASPGTAFATQSGQNAGSPGVAGGWITMLKSDGPPRMYLLQKIVEIAYYNMHRIRYEWTQIWQILQPYFCIVACHPSTHVATFAIDALRQLSMKFLEREELGHYATQH